MNKKVMEKYGFTFRKNLAEGMYGKVVSAYSTEAKKGVAIKIMDKRRLMPSYVDDFLAREVDIVLSLDHPNIVKTTKVFSEKSKVFLVMELCVNGDVLQYINTNGAFPERSCCKLFTQLCEAVQYLHDQDVVHRDLKCQNLLLDTHHNLKLCDFGFSKRLTYTEGALDLSKTYCGTSSYAAPEVLKSIPYNPKLSDVWSMGVVLYVMLHTVMPYDSDKIKKMDAGAIPQEINFPNTPVVSSEAKDLILSILHPDMQQRITIADMLQSSWILQKQAEDSPVQEQSPEGEAEDSSDPDEGPSFCK